MAETPYASIEQTDAENVNSALVALKKNDVARAKSVLENIVGRAPKDYVYEEDTPEGLKIKFWDQNQFIHYVSWLRSRNAEPGKSIIWVSSAYPRAYYYRGFIAVKEGDFPGALGWLDAGQQLEPVNPKLKCERAHAYSRMGQLQEALDLYSSVSEVGPFVSGADRALALRGAGFALIEMGNLDEAESAFRSSQEFDPNSQVARNELTYIAHLRTGGGSSSKQSVETISASTAICSVCKEKVTRGRVINFDGNAVMICVRCEGKLTKKWWQFWK